MASIIGCSEALRKECHMNKTDDAIIIQMHLSIFQAFGEYKAIAQKQYPHYMDEIRGIAEGCELDFDIVSSK